MQSSGYRFPMIRNESSDTASSGSSAAPKRIRRTLVGLLAFALLFAVGTFLFVGDWLVSEDPLQKADAIAVLSGGLPLRPLEAADVYRQGYAPKVLLTHPDEPGASLRAMGISYTGEDLYDKEILLHQGVPAGAIQVLDSPIRNTADELAVIFNTLDSTGLRTVIIVTSKVHTRRTRILCRRLANGKVRVLIHGVSDDPFRPNRWWTNTTDALDVVREVLGILNAWAGLPLRPAK